MSDPVRSVPPPLWLVQHVANPVLRLVLPSPAGRRLPLGLLRLSGRRSGRQYSVPVGVHDVDRGMAVFTDARWAQNFRGGADAVLVRGGRALAVRGELVEEPGDVGPWVRAVLDRGTSARRLGLSVAPGHRPTDAEVAAVRVAVLLRTRLA